jgi:uncharacterized protein
MKLIEMKEKEELEKAKQEWERKRENGELEEDENSFSNFEEFNKSKKAIER